MTNKRYEVIDTTEGRWHVLPNDPAHGILDLLAKAGWEEGQMILPVELFVKGHITTPAYFYESVAKSAAKHMQPNENNDRLLISLWNTWQQVRLIYDAQTFQSLQPGLLHEEETGTGQDDSVEGGFRTA